MTTSNLAKRVMGVALAAVLAAACASSGGGSGQPDSRGDFGREASSDPGLSDRTGSSSGAAKIDGLQNIYFGFDKYNLTAQAKELLRHNAATLGQSRGRLEIQGNTDERGTEEYNLALGKRRAQAAKRYLMDLGIQASKLSTISFGEENPAVRGSSEAAWAKNRRDEFVLR